MTILTEIGPFPSGRSYCMRYTPDPASPAVHCRVDLQFREEGGDYKNVPASTDPRTGGQASSWRAAGDPTGDLRPRVKLWGTIMNVDEAVERTTSEFLRFIESQEGTDLDLPAEQGLLEYLEKLRELPSDWIPV